MARLPESARRSPDTTGRRFLLIDDYREPGFIDRFAARLRVRALLPNQWLQLHPDASLDAGEALVLPHLGIAMINRDSARTLLPTVDSIAVGEPERRLKAMRGFSKAEKVTIASATSLPCLEDTDEYSWALRLTGADRSDGASANVRVCVVDAGIDLTHPDLGSHPPAPTHCFLPGLSVQECMSHCTHCTGLIAGQRPPNSTVEPREPRRYAVAPGVSIAIARILMDDESEIPEVLLFAALEWALSNRCHIVSMSLGTEWIGPGHSETFEVAAQRALEQDCIILAGTGNDSEGGVEGLASTLHPARCPTVIAVGSIDCREVPSQFSNGQVRGNDGKVDVVAPGESVYATWIDKQHKHNRGTSVACAFAAGIAALHKTRDLTMSGANLRKTLLERVKPLPGFDSALVGRGLVLAPP